MMNVEINRFNMADVLDATMLTRLERHAVILAEELEALAVQEASLQVEETELHPYLPNMDERGRKGFVSTQIGGMNTSLNNGEASRRVLVMAAVCVPRMFGFRLLEQYITPLDLSTQKGGGREAEAQISKSTAAQWRKLACMLTLPGPGGDATNVVPLDNAKRLVRDYGSSWAIFQAWWRTCLLADEGSPLRQVPPVLPNNGVDRERFRVLKMVFECEEEAYAMVRSQSTLVDLRMLRNFGRLGLPSSLPVIRNSEDGVLVTPQDGYVLHPQPEDGSWNNLLCEPMMLPASSRHAPQRVEVPVGTPGYATIVRDLQLLNRYYTAFAGNRSLNFALEYLLQKEYIKRAHVDFISLDQWKDWGIPFPYLTPVDVMTYISRILELEDDNKRECGRYLGFNRNAPWLGPNRGSYSVVRDETVNSYDAATRFPYDDRSRLTRVANNFQGWITQPPHAGQRLAVPPGGA
jgi:hypothetical protein